MSVKPLALVCLAVVSLVTAACGGGGGGGGGTLPSTAGSTSAPTATPTSSGAQSLPVSGGGVSGLLTVTAGGATLAATATTTNPTATSPLALRRSSSVATGAALLYVTITASANATITAFGGSFTLATAPSQAVHLGYWTGSEWDDLGAATVSGTTVTFAPTTLNPTIAANPSAYFVLYSSSTTLPTASPSPAPSSTASSPSPSPSASSGATFVDTACAQSPATQDGTLTSVAGTFFSSILPNAKTICLSAWDLSDDVDTALIAAAHNGASVTVITPYSENSSNSSDIAAIVAAGGHAKYEYTSSHGTPTASIAYQQAPFDIHAKFALVDGVAYMDGHNWFTTDVVMRDGIAGDFNAIQADLTTFATPAPSNGTFTTDKQVSLKNESAYLQSVIPGLVTGNEYDFITESFNPNGDGEYNDDVYDGMCQIAALPAHVTMHVMVEEYSGYSTAAKAALQNLLLLDPNASVHTDNNGHEKISMIRTTVGGAPSSAWFGSSNSTTTDLFDWGMDVTDPGILGALQSYFDGVFNPASSIPTPSPGVTAAPCATPHP